MPLDQNQVTNDRRINGYPINNKPTDTKTILRFNNTLKYFEYVSVSELSITPYEIQVARGDVPTAKPILIEGYSDIISTVSRLVWNAPITDFDLPVGAVNVTIVSNNPSDSIIGTGAHLVLVEGIANDDTEIVEVVVMNGITPVVLANQMKFINFVTVIQTGSSNQNDGIIRIYHDSDPNKIMSWVDPSSGLARTSGYMVPKDHTLFVKFVSNATDKGTDILMMFKIRLLDGTGLAFDFPLFQNTVIFPFEYLTVATERTIIKMFAQTSTGATKKVNHTTNSILIKNS